MPRTGLSDRQRRFIEEYRGEGDGVRAARAAGYSGGNHALAVRAHQLLQNPEIRDAIDLRIRERALADAQAREKRLAELAATPAAPMSRSVRRLALLHELAEDRNLPAIDRVRAMKLAAEIDGDIGRGRLDPSALPPDPRQLEIPGTEGPPEPMLNGRGPDGLGANGGTDAQEP